MTEEQEEEDYTIKQYNLYNYGKIKTDKVMNFCDDWLVTDRAESRDAIASKNKN